MVSTNCVPYLLTPPGKGRMPLQWDRNFCRHCFKSFLEFYRYSSWALMRTIQWKKIFFPRFSQTAQIKSVICTLEMSTEIDLGKSNLFLALRVWGSLGADNLSGYVWAPWLGAFSSIWASVTEYFSLSFSALLLSDEVYRFHKHEPL